MSTPISSTSTSITTSYTAPTTTMASRHSSATSSFTAPTDIDFFTISPCPLTLSPSNTSTLTSSSSSSSASSPTSSHITYLSPSSYSTTTDRDLWRCMLEVQARWGCYRSARIEAALAMSDDEDSEELMPSRAILDIMNEDVASMPEEAKKSLARFITIPEPAPFVRPRKYQLRFWRNRG